MNESLQTNEEIKNFSLSEHNKQNFIAKLNQLDLTQGYVASVTKKKVKRTDLQNNLIWQFFTDFGHYLGYEGKQEIEALKAYVTLQVSPLFIPNPHGGDEIAIPPKTSNLSTKEFGELMDKLMRYAAKENFYFEVQS